MADGAQTTLTGPAAKVAAFVNQAIARIRREAQTAVDSAVNQARADIDRIAREAADNALAEARAASAEAQQARADMAAMQAEMSATRDEIREMLEELRARQAEHDQMFASFDDLDGDGIPDAFQTGTDIAVAPQTAPASMPPIEVRVEGQPDPLTTLDALATKVAALIMAGRGEAPEAANDDGGLSFREGSPAVVSGKKMRKILELAIRADACAAALQPMVFRTRDAFVAYMEERDEDLREALEGTWPAEDPFEDALGDEVKRRLTVAEEEGLV